MNTSGKFVITFIDKNVLIAKSLTAIIFSDFWIFSKNI